MELGLNYSLKQEVSMRQNLSLRIEHNKMLEYGNLGKLLECIAESPEIVEEVVKDRAGNTLTNSDNKKNTMAMLSFFFDSENGTNKKSSGLIMNGGLDYLEDIFDIEGVDLSADVIYEAKKEGKPILHFNDRLIIKPKLLNIQISKEFENTRNVYAKILKQYQWQAEKLRSVYNLIGENQREFIGSLDKLHFNKYNMDDLAEDLGFRSTSTAHRLIDGRRVYVNPVDGEGASYFVKDLLKTKDKIREIYTKDKLIKYFLSGEDRIDVLFDWQLRKNLRLPVARKTISKYREQLGIPGSSKRKEIYCTRK